MVIASSTPIFSFCTPQKYHNTTNTFTKIFKRSSIVGVVKWCGHSLTTMMMGTEKKVSPTTSS